MSYYSLLNKDNLLASFEIINNTVSLGVLNIQNIDYFPLPLKRLHIDANKYVDRITDDGSYHILNENGCQCIEKWLYDRQIPINRENINKYVDRKSQLTQYMLDNKAFALIDNYWIRLIDEDLTWKDILIKRDKIDECMTCKVGNKEYYKEYNSTLGGQLEKFWYKEVGILMLCKKTSKMNEILNAREVLASLIYQKQDEIDYTPYQFVYDSENEIIGCKCKSFITDDSTELITAYDLLEEHDSTQDDNCYELIIEYANRYGLSKEKAQKYLDAQTIVDYLITNRDRHQKNIGFIRDSDTHEIISAAPVFDNGSAINFEGAYPEEVNNTSINGLYSTEQELLSHVKDFSLIDIDKLPTENEIRTTLSSCHYTSDERKEKLTHLYLDKIERLKEIQR